MKSLIIALSLALAASVSFARAAKTAEPAASNAAAPSTAVADGTQPGTPQRSRMKTCNADAKAKDIHGPDRRAFMKQCLSTRNKPAAAS